MRAQTQETEIAAAASVGRQDLSYVRHAAWSASFRPSEYFQLGYTCVKNKATQAATTLNYQDSTKREQVQERERERGWESSPGSRTVSLLPSWRLRGPAVGKVHLWNGSAEFDDFIQIALFHVRHAQLPWINTHTHTNTNTQTHTQTHRHTHTHTRARALTHQLNDRHRSTHLQIISTEMHFKDWDRTCRSNLPS